MHHFIFIEDRDQEHGHGWRDVQHRLVLDGVDGAIRAEIYCEQDESYMSSPRPYASCSYAWICPAEYWEQNHHLDSKTRTKDITFFHPHFKGVSDMESHFEFVMTPKEMRDHLLKLGLKEIKR